MSVIELIELLSKFPAGMQVYIGKGMGPCGGIDVPASSSGQELLILRVER
jgi:hypothetical protein